MSSLQVTSWTPEEIANWIKGLDNALEQYIPNFLAHQVTGDRLLKMTIQELENMKVTKMGHQELILEAIDLLALVHYGHPTETLQSVALNLNCKASNLASLLEQRMQSGNHPRDRLYCMPSTILLRVSETISAAKTLISWLDRPPFSNGPERDFQEISKDILHYALELTQAVQENSDLTKALREITAVAREFAAIADNLIKQSTDPLVIQPTTIEEVRIKKKRPEEELGLFIKTSTIDGIHYITGTKDQSAASLSRKVGSGDELLKVNEQTVVSWEHSKVVAALKHDPMGVYLTLRKRPCNLGTPGQILRPGNSPYTSRLGGTPQLIRKDSFPTMKSPVSKEFLMPMSPNDLLISKQRSNSDPETQLETHETHSDPESLVQEAARITHRRGTMGEALQRKGSKSQTTEGRPRSLPINTEEFEAEVALWKSSPISTRPNFSPIVGSPASPPSTSTHTSPSPHGDKTPNRTANPLDVVANSSGSSVAKKVTIFQAEDSSPSKSDSSSPSDSASVLSKPVVEISKPTEDSSCQDAKEIPVSVETPTSSETVQSNPVGEETPSSPETPRDPSAETVEPSNTNNNVAASAVADSLEKTLNSQGGVVTSEVDDYVLVESAPTSPSKSVSFVELRKQSSAPSIISEASITSTGVRLRPKKTRRKYKVTRGVSCVDLGPGQCEGWLHKKSETKQTFRSNWMEMWFVLKDFALYYYKNKNDIKAKGIICLPGYLISDAPESKRENAFKATHKGTKTVYFAAQRRQDMEKWMRNLGLAAIMYTDQNKVRQSIIFESQPSVDMGAMMQSVDGYHSESDDEEKDKSDQSAPLSPSSSDKSDENSSESGSPHRRKLLRAQTAPDLHPHSDESDDALDQFQMSRPPSVSVTSPDSNGKSVDGATANPNDDLLDHYKTLTEDTGGVSGLERTWEARSSKRFKKGVGLRRIETVLDKNPEKNKKALQRRALQRTLKAKQEELHQLESLLSETALSSASLQEWRTAHGDLLDHVLTGPKPASPSDSDLDDDDGKHDQDATATKISPRRKGGENETGLVDGVTQPASASRETSPVAEGPSRTDNADTNTGGNSTSDEKSNMGESGHRSEEDCAMSTEAQETERLPSPAVLEVSGMARSSLVLEDSFRARAGSEASETSF